MNVLERKFGTKMLVVQDIISQVEKMKPVTTDKMFIEFVEKLQKIKLDLDSLDQISEIANAGYMGKIEKKLPLVFSTEWWKLVTTQPGEIRRLSIAVPANEDSSGSEDDSPIKIDSSWGEWIDRWSNCSAFCVS